MTPEVRATIQSRADAATPGPWGCHEYGARHEDGPTAFAITGTDHCFIASTAEYSSCADANAEFMAHAREDIPALLEALRESEALITFLRAALKGVLEAMPERYRPINEKQGAIDYARAALAEPSAEGGQA